MRRWTLIEIIAELQKIRDMGWIPTRRAHDTGIGKTLEDMLGIEENNIEIPDFGVFELKSQRKASSSMITLFTKKPRGITNKDLLERFGYPDKEHPDIKVLHQTVSKRKNAQGFYFRDDLDVISIYRNEEYLGFYETEMLKKKVLEKIGDGVILVFGDEKKEDGETFFAYKKAYLLAGLNFEGLINKMFYDIRMGAYKSGTKKGKPHDHGSGFRLKNTDLESVFKVYKRIL